MLMILPRFCRIITRPAAWHAKNVPFKFTLRVASKSSSRTLSAGFPGAMPALFTKMSNRPNLATVSSTAREICSILPISICNGSTLRPMPSISRANSPSALMSRNPSPMLAPAWARASEIAWPRPRAAPVTSATCPVKSNLGNPFIGCHYNQQFTPEMTFHFRTVIPSEAGRFAESFCGVEGPCVCRASSPFDNRICLERGNLLAYNDLRDWIAALDRAGELKRIKTEADPILEIAEITDRVSKSNVGAGVSPVLGAPSLSRSSRQGGGSALLFQNIKGHPGAQVLINQFGSESRMKMALEVDSLDEIADRIRAFMDVKSPQGFLDKVKMLPMLAEMGKFFPKTVPTGACKEVIRKDNFSLSEF